jgi:hypothetical protein
MFPVQSVNGCSEPLVIGRKGVRKRDLKGERLGACKHVKDSRSAVRKQSRTRVVYVSVRVQRSTCVSFLENI